MGKRKHVPNPRYLEYNLKYCTRRIIFVGSTALRFTATGCREAHTNFADESACVTGDSVRNEVVTIHRSQVALKMLFFYTYISFATFTGWSGS
jgi:hypothetical protein